MFKDRLKLLLKDSAIYGLAGGISRFFVLISLPIIVKNLSTSEFGIYAILQVVMNLSAAIILFGMDSAIVFCLKPEEQEDVKAQDTMFTNGLIVQICLAFVITLALVAFQHLVISLTNIGARYEFSYYAACLGVPAVSIVQYMQNWFKWRFKRVQFLINALGLTILNLVVLWACTRFYGLNLQRVMLISSGCQWFIAFMGLVVTRKNWKLSYIKKETLWSMAKFGYAMMLIAVFSILIPSADRFFLTHYVSPERLGLYAFAQRISIIMTMAVAAFQIAFGPFFVSIWNKPDAKETFAKFQTYYLLFVGALGLVIAGSSKVIIKIFANDSYLTSNSLLPALIAGSFTYGLYSFASIGIYYSKKSHYNLFIIIAGFLATAFADWVLTPWLLEYGVTIGFWIGNIVLVTLGYCISNKYYCIPFYWKKDIQIMLIWILAVAFLYSSPFKTFGNIYAEAGLNFLLSILLTIATALLALSGSEKASLVRIIRKLR